MKKKKTMVVRREPPAPDNVTHIVDIRVAFKGRQVSPHDNQYLEEALERLRQVGAAEVIREGVIWKPFDDWDIQDLRQASWEEDE